MTITDRAVMRGVVLDGPGRVALRDRPVPGLTGPEDLLVRVRATGICGTDRGIALGEFPARPGILLGHETVGEVAFVGPGVTSVRAGDRVVLNPTFYCGQCHRCRRGLPALCGYKDGREIGVDCDGTMTAFAVVHQRFAHRVPPSMPYQRAALIEPLACVLANLDAAPPRWDDLVTVVGGGPIGMLVALTLAVRGFAVCLVERDPLRAALAVDVLPRSVSVFANATGRLIEAFDAVGRRPDLIVDTTGVLLAEAVDLVEMGGAVVVMGERQGARATLDLRSLATRAVRVIGAGPYPPHLFQVAVELATSLPLESVVTHEMPLSRASEAFALLGVRPGTTEPAEYRAGKVLLVPDGWNEE